MNPHGQEQLEIAVLEDMVRRARPENAAALKSQLNAAKVVSRDFTGVGVYTSFEVDRNALRFSPSKLEGIAFMVLEDKGLTNAARFADGAVATFQIAIDGGHLASLEGLMLDGDWPSDVRKFEIEPLFDDASANIDKGPNHD